MNATHALPPLLETGLALLLFLPTFAIIAGLYLAFPRRPRPRWRLAFDLFVVLAAAAASAAAMSWGFHIATGVGGAIWRQLLATLLAYAAFATVIVAGVVVRGMLWRGLPIETVPRTPARHSRAGGNPS